MITSKVERQVDLPHEPGEWVRVRMPSFRILAHAREMKSAGAIRMMTSLSAADVDKLQALGSRTNGNGSHEFDTDPADADRFAAYDTLVLLLACILAWSYEEPVTPDAIEELDEKTVDVLLDVLVPAVAEADRKKGSVRSTRR